MSGQPTHRSVGQPDEPDRGQRGSSGNADPDPARTSDFGRFDWFADSMHFGLPDAPAAGSGRSDPRDDDGRERAGSERSDLPGRLRGWRLVAGAAGLALTCTLLGGIVGGFVAVNKAADQTNPTFRLGPAPPPAPTNRPPNSVAGIAARDTPAVVMIKVNGNAGTGSGFVISGGYIVTDSHVVTLDGLVSNGSLRVYFSDGKSAAGQVVGHDPYSDIAVLKVAGRTDLPALSLGNSASVEVGDPVIAIGSPLGLADTVTSGIISAVNRPVQPGAGNGKSPRVFFDAIQTDAPINPGNSGGPLVNARGQVIGVDAAIDTLGEDPVTGSQGGSIGLGFAIPVDQARRVILQLIRTGHASHSIIGATLNQSFAGDGAQIETVGQRGVPAVAPGGPAARAGLRAGDIITDVGGLPITTPYSLIDAISSLAPGSTVTVRFTRNGQARQARITLGSAGS